MYTQSCVTFVPYILLYLLEEFTLATSITSYKHEYLLKYEFLVKVNHSFSTFILLLLASVKLLDKLPLVAHPLAHAVGHETYG